MATSADTQQPVLHDFRPMVEAEEVEPLGTQVKGKIRDRTDRRCARLPLEYAVENVNHVVLGWGTTSGTETPRRSSRRSTAMSTNASRSSPAAGTDSLAETESAASTRMVHQARRLSPNWNGYTHDCVCPPVNDVGEPCAGEPHARFDLAAGGDPTSRASTRRAAAEASVDPTLQLSAAGAASRRARSF